MQICHDFFYLSADGRTNIHAVRWQGEDAPRGVVQIAHGICDHVERYDHLADWLVEHGFVVVANDHLGHGKSWQEPERQGAFGEKNGWELALSDMERLREQTAAQYPGLPYFLLGHSMGSFLTRTYLIKYPGRVTGAILSGTGQQDPRLLKSGYALARAVCLLRGPLCRTAFLKKLMFGSYNLGFRPNRTEYDWVCGNDEVVDAYCQDPACQFLPTAGLCRDMMGGLLFISDPDNLELMEKNTPVLLVSGDKDPVGENGKGVERSYQGFLQAGCADVQCKLYPEGRHEILNEVWRETVYRDLLTWMEERL